MIKLINTSSDLKLSGVTFLIKQPKVKSLKKYFIIIFDLKNGYTLCIRDAI